MSSVASCADRQDRSLYKKPSIHRRNNSGELDVFEAANYFSLATNMTINQQHQSVSSQKPNKDHINDHVGRPKGGRMSLELIGRSSKIKVSDLKNSHKVHDDDEDQVVKGKMIKNSKQKQPSSPGGKLASFLNSLFNNSLSKKKKSSKQDDQMKQRMRRSSISHIDSRSLYLSSSSATGFRTPPPVYKTFFDDSKSLQDHKRVITIPMKSSIGLMEQRPTISNGLSLLPGFDKSQRNLVNRVGEKEKKIEFEFKKVDNNVSKPELHKVEKNIDIVKYFEFKKHIKDDEEDEGYQSDTSSDLFELPNYDLGEFPSGLPLYETTNVEKIKNSAKPDSK